MVHNLVNVSSIGHICLYVRSDNVSRSANMPPSKPAYDVDWIFSNNSDVHVANHRDWFATYTPFATHFDSGMGGVVQVEGIGDVELPTKTHPTYSGAAYPGTITLRDVLYSPKSLCNIIGGLIMDDYDYEIRFGDVPGKITATSNGARVGLLDAVKLIRLRLRGQNAKQTSLDRNSHYFIRANWPDSERRKLESFRSKRSSQADVSVANTDDEGPPLTQDEKKWLKDHYGGEFHFLRQHGLSIYKEEDRDEGRSILRALMQDDDSDDADELEDSDAGSINSFLRDLEQDSTSHFADHLFSEPELDWIKVHYRHSGNFLYTHGLKFYDDDDCRQGKAIVQAMLSEDGEGSED